VKSRVRLPGDIISRLRLHQHPESLKMKFVRHGIHQICPGVVNSLGTPRSGIQPTPGQGPAWTRILFQGLGIYMARSAVWRWGKRVKCRMKCFYETRSHGPQDQDFDVISIWRLYLPGVEPGISRWLVGITTATPWMLSSDLMSVWSSWRVLQPRSWNPGFDSREI